MMRGDVDMLQEVDRDSVEFLEGRVGDRDVLLRFAPSTSRSSSTCGIPILSHVEVRRAMQRSHRSRRDRQNAMRGHGQWPTIRSGRTTGPTARAARPPTIRTRRASGSMRPGCPVQGPGPATDGEPVPVHVPVLERRSAVRADRAAAATAAVATSASTGAREPIPVLQLSRRLSSGDFDSCLMPMSSGRSFEWTYRFWHSPNGQHADFRTPATRGQTRSSTGCGRGRSDAEIRIAVADLQQRFHEDAPAVFLAWPETTRAVDARVRRRRANRPGHLREPVALARGGARPRAAAR